MSKLFSKSFTSSALRILTIILRLIGVNGNVNIASLPYCSPPNAPNQNWAISIKSTSLFSELLFAFQLSGLFYLFPRFLQLSYPVPRRFQGWKAKNGYIEFQLLSLLLVYILFRRQNKVKWLLHERLCILSHRTIGHHSLISVFPLFRRVLWFFWRFCSK